MTKAALLDCYPLPYAMGPNIPATLVSALYRATVHASLDLIYCAAH